MPTRSQLKTSRIVVSVEESIFVAITALAEQENTSCSELVRSLVVTYLISRGLLPEVTLQKLVGKRD